MGRLRPFTVVVALLAAAMVIFAATVPLPGDCISPQGEVGPCDPDRSLLLLGGLLAIVAIAIALTAAGSRRGEYVGFAIAGTGYAALTAVSAGQHNWVIPLGIGLGGLMWTIIALLQFRLDEPEPRTDI